MLLATRALFRVAPQSIRQALTGGASAEPQALGQVVVEAD
jgi:hypothetical protein